MMTKYGSRGQEDGESSNKHNASERMPRMVGQESGKPSLRQQVTRHRGFNSGSYEGAGRKQRKNQTALVFHCGLATAE